MYEFNAPEELSKRIFYNVGAALCLSVLAGKITTMIWNNKSETEKLAETTFKSVYVVVDKLLTKAENIGLSDSEDEILSQLSQTLSSLSEHYDFNIHIINNRVTG